MTDQTLEGFRLSPFQGRHWAVRSHHGGEAWNATATVRVAGALDAERLRAALEEVARQQEILRTGFQLLPGTRVPVQTICDEPQLRFESHDLAGLADEERAAWIEAKQTELEGEAFDLTGADVLRAILLTVGPDEHRLLLAQPAMAADAAGLWNLVRELAAALRGESASTADADEEPMQYADFAEWLHENFESEDAATGLAFWRKVDLDAARTLRLPQLVDPDVLSEGPARGRVTRLLSDEEEAAVERVADACGVEPASVRLAAWAAVVARLAERGEPVLGVESPGRGFEGLDVALGPFARALPVAVIADGDSSFAELVRGAHAARQGAEEWHELFDYERAGGAAEELLSVGFADRPLPAPETAGDVTFALERRTVAAEPFHVVLEHDASHGGPALSVAHDPRVLPAADASCLLEQAATYLSNACASPDAPSGSISMLSADERRRALEELASGTDVAGEPTTIHGLIEEQAARTPDAVAVVAYGRQLTYTELDRGANRLARHLRALGVGPDVFVGLYLDRSVEMVLAILGVLKAGGAYLPLPPGYPAERVAFMVADTQAPVVLTRSREGESLPAYEGRVVRLDADREEIEGHDDGPLDALAGPGNRAYVIHTSGSTGRPKGVPITHANLVSSTRARMAHYERPVESYLLLSSFAFDSSVAGIFWTLCQGGRLVLPEDGFEQEIPSIAELVAMQGVTHVLALPSLYGLVLDTSGADKLGSLSTVIVAGETCPPALVERHAELLPGARLFNEYGPTEGTVWSTVHDCTGSQPRARVPIGRPIPGARIYVVEGEGQPAPVGVPGEIWIGGNGIAPGYLERPELSAERFVVDPFSEDDERFLYRTGDLGRWLPEGDLEFLGRIDHQVKVRGYRIELEEIESVLAQHPAVREAAVLVREDDPGDQRIVAYATAEGAAPEPATLRDHLAGSLPDYMLPAHFVLLDAMPLLPNGKVDRKGLPAPEHDRAGVRTEYAEPDTPLEKALAVIWADVLKVDRVGANDDFFELGGHSILATQLFARMVDTLQVKIPLRAIFDHHTVRALAAEILRDPAERERIERTAEIVLQVLTEPGTPSPGSP